ncbi:MAG TPA: hypothetical protein VFJ94_03910 [Intrasporangium sp.]|uniref:hypothetical protein n=1 Tax=Intrasporangium sp. TaxID=1925024 RepID=UPI002D781BEC|nr:hypothetical protein [Intrasporangium sp.]HET7397648.1 hypothetical protein [Intrasporangium sp.]
MSPDDLLVVYAFASWVMVLAAVALWSDHHHTPDPTPHRTHRPTCQAARCGRPAYWLATHRDGHHMWTCPGCHATGLHAGWLTDPIDGPPLRHKENR